MAKRRPYKSTEDGWAKFARELQDVRIPALDDEIKRLKRRVAYW